MATNNLNMIAELRQDAIDSFFDTLEANGYDLESSEAQQCIGETADSFVPAYNATLLELAAAPYGECPANFFLLASVENNFGGNVTASDVLRYAVREWLCDEIRQALETRIEEQKEEDREEEENEATTQEKEPGLSIYDVDEDDE